MSKRMPTRALEGRVILGVGDLVDADLSPEEIDRLALAAGLVDPDRPDVQVVI